MINVSYDAIKKCNETLVSLNDASREIQGMKYIMSTLLGYCISKGLRNINIDDELIGNLLLIFEDELRQAKLDYVQSKIDIKSYSFLPRDVSLGLAVTIPNHTSLQVDGFEQRFIYLPAGSGIKKHTHNKNNNTIELYSRLFGLMKIFGEVQDINICPLNGTHEIDRVDSLAIVETFKIKPELLTEQKIDGVVKTLKR